MTQQDGTSSTALERLLQRARQEPVEVSPYLETRILARLREQEQKRKVVLWRWIAVLSPVLSIAGVLIFLQTQKPAGELQAFVGRGVTVRIDVADKTPVSGGQEIAFAEVELPEGVYFKSDRHPEVRERRTLVVAWRPEVAHPYIPLVIESESAGEKAIRVRFLDSNNGIVAEKSLKVRFVRST